MATFQSLAATLNADCVELRQRPSDKGMTGQFLIRRRVDQSDFMEIRCVCVCSVKISLFDCMNYLDDFQL